MLADVRNYHGVRCTVGTNAFREQGGQGRAARDARALRHDLSFARGRSAQMDSIALNRPFRHADQTPADVAQELGRFDRRARDLQRRGVGRTQRGRCARGDPQPARSRGRGDRNLARLVHRQPGARATAARDRTRIGAARVRIDPVRGHRASPSKIGRSPRSSTRSSGRRCASISEHRPPISWRIATAATCRLCPVPGDAVIAKVARSFGPLDGIKRLEIKCFYHSLFKQEVPYNWPSRLGKIRRSINLLSQYRNMSSVSQTFVKPACRSFIVLINAGGGAVSSPYPKRKSVTK